MHEINSVITDFEALRLAYIVRDGYVFTAFDVSNVYDAIVIRNPADAVCSQRLGRSIRTLAEHIEIINSHQIEKAIVIADDISFLESCPTLKWLWIQPSNSAPNDFDFSPLYQMPQLYHLRCESVYGEKENMCGIVNYAKLPHLKSVSVHSEDGQINFETLPELRILNISNVKGKKNANDYFSSALIKELTFLSCGIESLNGIERCKELEFLALEYNRKLSDISAITKVATTLKVLNIENCPKISEFECLKELVNLEVLDLKGSNALPSLDFLRYMEKLKVFSFSMNVLDGDLNLCTQIPYVCSERNRKHYNLKDKDLPKNLNQKTGDGSLS